METSQGDLFAAPAPALPEGFRYEAGVISDAVQFDLVREIAKLPLKPFDFHGFAVKRRVISYGWKYDFDTEHVTRIGDIPPFLLPVRSVAAAFAGIERDQLKQARVTEYAPIGWHKDKKVFARVVGVSLLSRCTRCRAGSKWELS
jgi:alkylated DNA repair dioxygenase AlkB